MPPVPEYTLFVEPEHTALAPVTLQVGGFVTEIVTQLLVIEQFEPF